MDPRFREEKNPNKLSYYLRQRLSAATNEEDNRSTSSRGVFGSNQSLFKETKASDKSEVTIEGVPNELPQQAKQLNSYLGIEGDVRRQAYVLIERLQEKTDQAASVFSQLGKLDNPNDSYSIALIFAKRHINLLKKILNEAEQITDPTEQYHAFNTALQNMENEKFERICKPLDEIMESAVESQRARCKMMSRMLERK